MMIEFMQTDLPEPVVPAISIWGNFAILPIIQLPPISLPTAKEDLDFALWNSLESITSRRETVFTARLGTSIPTTETLSGIGAIRTPVAPRFSARSSAEEVSLLRRTPFASSTSYRVTLGPRVTFMIWASILKLASASFSLLVFSRISAVPSFSPSPGSFNSSMGG